MSPKKVNLKSANLQLVKENNRALLFRLIYVNEPISRVELAQMTGLSPTTVSSLVDELVEDGMVEIVGIAKTATSGRKPVMLRVNQQGGYMVGVELTPAGFRMAAYDLRMNLVSERVREVEDYEKIGEEIINGIEGMLNDLGAGSDRLNGVCIGVPGVMDNETCRVVSSTLIPIREDNDFYHVIRARFPDITLRMGNESGYSAYIEKSRVEKDVHTLVYIEINDGIGAGIIIDDEIFTGAFGNAGEFGHISVDLNGKPCKCGNRGCLEAAVNLTEIKKAFAGINGGDGDLSHAAELLEKHDEEAVAVLAKICRTLAAGVNNVINMLNPDAIVIGGGAAELGKPLLDGLSDALSQICVKSGTKKPELSLSAVNSDQVTRGCARYLLDHALTRKVF